MKKIITAKEQWTNDVNASYNKYGEFENISYHKIEDDGIGIINDNEMYHFDEGGQDDVFYIKVGDTFSKVVCPVSSEMLVQTHWRNFDLSETWFDTGKLMEWLFLTDSNGDKDYPCVESILGLSMYELIWMHIYGSECTETTYQDIEVEVEDIPEVKQTFLQDAEQNAHYVDEVAGIAYWYNESLDAATLYIGDDTNKQYCRAHFAPFSTMSANEFKDYIDYVAKTFDVKDEKFTFDSINVWRAKGDITNYQYLHYYCDFIMQGGRTPNSTHLFESPKSQPEPKVDGYAEQIALIKKRLISDIEDKFNSFNEEKFDIRRVSDRDFFNDIDCEDNDMWLQRTAIKQELRLCFNYCDDDVEMNTCSLTDLHIDELYHIYSQML